MRLLHSSAALLEYTQALPEVNADQMTRLCAPADVKLGRAVGKDGERGGEGGGETGAISRLAWG